MKDFLQIVGVDMGKNEYYEMMSDFGKLI
jgi:hypothetical protein